MPPLPEAPPAGRPGTGEQTHAWELEQKQILGTRWVTSWRQPPPVEEVTGWLAHGAWL